MNQRGFTFLEVILALMWTGLVAGALLLALAQGRRTQALTREWAREETRATELLMEGLLRWQALRTDQARRIHLIQTGDDTRLGPWEWRAEALGSAQGRSVDLHRVKLRWREREVETHAVLRVVP